MGMDATASRSSRAQPRPLAIILYAWEAIIAALSVHNLSGG